MTYRIPYFCISHIGRCRHTNQDNFICEGKFRKNDKDSESESVETAGTVRSDRPALLGVFDGMGGEECGEEAALLAAEEASETPVNGDPEEMLLGLCKRANARICRFADQNGVQSMGATAALLAFGAEEIALCNIGDSKILGLTGRKLEQFSCDHVCAAPYGMKPPLSQNLGIPPSEILIEPYTARRDYGSGDIYLICSDGLTDMVPREEIEEILCEIQGSEKDGRSLRTAASALMNEALANGGRDNITVILCEILPEAQIT